MGLKIDLAAGRISPEAYNVLIKGRKAVLEDDETVMSGRGAALSGLAGRGQRGAAQQVKEMLTADALAHLKALSHVEGFYDILNQVRAEEFPERKGGGGVCRDVSVAVIWLW